VGFGLACVPVRCAHPSFWAHCHPNGALRAPPCPSQLRCFSFDKNLSNVGPPRQRLFSLHWTTCRLQRPRPPIAAPLILPAIFWGQNYVPVRHYALIFSVFPFFIVWIFNFCYSLLFIPSFLISSYSSLLILLFLSLLFLLVGATCILRLLIFFSSYILNCLLYCRHNISVILRGFSRGPSLFWFIWGQN
jgi:hypothetical protein